MSNSISAVLHARTANDPFTGLLGAEWDVEEKELGYWKAFCELRSTAELPSLLGSLGESLAASREEFDVHLDLGISLRPGFTNTGLTLPSDTCRTFGAAKVDVEISIYECEPS